MNAIRILPHIAALALYSMPATAADRATTDGTIHFADGRSVEVLAFSGDAATPSPLFVGGMIGAQRVEYKIADLKEIHFHDHAEKAYTQDARYRGSMTVVGRTGNRTVIENAYLAGWRNGGTIPYVHVDPLTGRPTSAETFIQRSVSHIILGESAGRLKQNATNKEFFPARYVFDPYTGERLVWADRE